MNSELTIESTLGQGSQFSFDIRFSLGELSLVEQSKVSADTLTGLNDLLISQDKMWSKSSPILNTKTATRLFSLSLRA